MSYVRGCEGFRDGLASASSDLDGTGGVVVRFDGYSTYFIDPGSTG